MYRDALKLFEGNINTARNWLSEPSQYLEGKPPLNIKILKQVIILLNIL
jgi:uncharacterized protein (DUF2384 family)